LLTYTILTAAKAFLTGIWWTAV